MRFIIIFILGLATAAAQYRTESFDLTAGWNAIYLNVDPGDVSVSDAMTGRPEIIEVWEWRPKGLDPSLVTFDNPSEGADEWRVWRKEDAANSDLARLVPNAAYLVRTRNDAGNLTLRLKGKVVAPRVRWRTDSANLVGFPIKTATTPRLTRYLENAGLVDNNTAVFRYVGGELSATNPVESPARLVNAKRGEAFWIRSTKFADFYGPVTVNVALDDGLNFGDSGSLKRVTVTNRTTEEITVTLAVTPSESAPGVGPPPGLPALTTRSRNADGFYIYAPMGGSQTLTIPARESTGLTLGIDRAAMGGAAGDQFAGLLQVTDSGNFSEIYLPITAEVPDLAGLWVGEAHITHVQNQLQRFQRGPDGTYLVDENGNYLPVLKLDGDGNPVLDGGGNPIPEGDTGLNPTAQVYKLKLIVHLDDQGQATLLNRVYSGIISEDAAGNTLTGLTTSESLLDPGNIASAKRLSCTHLPGGLIQRLGGSLAPGGSLATTVILGKDHPTNPFIHLYHPDHDNKDARFENILPDGIESHRVERAITLTISSAADPGEGPQWGTSLLSGTYSETLTGIHKNPILISGYFALSKASDDATLLQN